MHSLGAKVHATMSKVRINVLRDYKLPLPSRINRIWNENIVYKNIAKLKLILKSIFTGFALFRPECRSAAMSEVRSDFSLD